MVIAALIYLKKLWLYGYKISVFPVVSGSGENTACFATGSAFLAVFQDPTVASFQLPFVATGLWFRPPTQKIS
jgi:hypothetical protein